MSYTISNPDGSTLVLLGDRKLDQSTTSLTLIGKNWAGYGEHINNNFIKLLSNNATPSSNPPRSPLKGQLWYDTTTKRLKLYDGTFNPISGAIVSGTQPSNLISGDLWWDPNRGQLHIYANNDIYLVGPAFQFSAGEIGFVLPRDRDGNAVVVKDIDNSSKNVAFLRNYGELLGFIANEQFDISTSSVYTNLTGYTTSTVKGLTVFGDIKYTGKINNNYLSLEVDFDRVFPTSLTTYRDITISSDFEKQHQAIVRLLNWTFPINNTTGTISNLGNPSSIEKGVPLESESRVLCKFTLPSPGYQVRRYIARSNGWDMVVINPSVTTLTNVVNTFYQGDIF